MRNVKLYIATTLDGYIAGPNGEIDWLNIGGDLDYGYQEFYDSIDTTLMGHSTYRLTLTVPEFPYPDNIELVLEPSDNPATAAFKNALFEQGIPLAAFAVDDIQKEYERMKKLGVEFRMEPTAADGPTVAVFDDTCGNLIQLYQED